MKHVVFCSSMCTHSGFLKSANFVSEIRVIKCA